MAVYNNFKLSFPSEEQPFIQALIDQCISENITTFSHFSILSVTEIEEIINDLSSSGHPFYSALGTYLFSKAAAISSGDDQQKWDAYKASFPDDYESSVQSLIDILRAAPNNLTFDSYKTKSAGYVAGIIYSGTLDPDWMFFHQLAGTIQTRASRLFDGWLALHNTYAGEEQKAIAELLDYFQIALNKPDYSEFLALQTKGIADSIGSVHADSLYIQNVAKTFRTRLNDLVSNYTPTDVLEQRLIDSYRNEMKEGVRQLILSLKASGAITTISELLSVPQVTGSVSFSSIQTATASLPQQTGIVISGTPAIGQTYVVEINNKDVVFFKTTEATIANVTAGLTAAINTVTAGEWESVTAMDEGATNSRVVVTHNSNNISFTLSTLSNNYFPFLQAFIANLPSIHPLYFSLGSSLYTDAILFREAGKVNREIKGRLVKLDGAGNDVPLSNYKVQILDIDDVENPAELGTVSSNKDGYFNLSYTLPNQTITEKKIRIKVSDAKDLVIKIIPENTSNLFINAGNGSFEGGTAPNYTEWNITKGTDIAVSQADGFKTELAGNGSWFSKNGVAINNVYPISYPGSITVSSPRNYFVNGILQAGKKYKISFQYKNTSTITLNIGSASQSIAASSSFALYETEATFDAAQITYDNGGNPYLTEIVLGLYPTTEIHSLSITEVETEAYEGQFSPKFSLNASNPSTDLVFKGNTAASLTANTDYEISAYVYFKSSILDTNEGTTGIYLKPDTYDFNDLKSAQVVNGIHLIEYIEGGLIRKTESRDKGFWYKISTRFNSGSNTSLAIGLYLKGTLSDYKANFEFNIDKLEVVKGLDIQQDFIADEDSENIILLGSLPSSELNASVSQTAGASQKQKSVIIPENIEQGDLIILDLNGGGTVSYKVTDPTLSVVTAGITDAINTATGDLTITETTAATSTAQQTTTITPVDVRPGAKYIVAKSPKNLFIDGDKGTFEDYGSGIIPPYEAWNLTNGGTNTSVSEIGGAWPVRGSYSAYIALDGDFQTGVNLIFSTNTPVKIKPNTIYKIAAFLTHSNYDLRLNNNGEFYLTPSSYTKEALLSVKTRKISTSINGHQEIYTIFNSGGNNTLTFEFLLELQNGLIETGGQWGIDEVRLEEYSENAISVEYATSTGTASDVVTGLRNVIKENSAALEISIEQYADELNKHTYHLIPSDVASSQKFTLLLNEKESIEYISTTGSVSNVTTALTALINSKTSGEWSNVTAEDETTHIVLSSKNVNTPFSIKQIGGEWSDILDESVTTSEIILTGRENNMPFTITQLGGAWKTVSASNHSTYIEVTADADNTPFTITAKLVKNGSNKISIDAIAEAANMVLPASIASVLRIKKAATLDDIAAMGGLSNKIDGQVTMESSVANPAIPQYTRIYISSVQPGNIFTFTINGGNSITYIAEDENLSNTLAGLASVIDGASGEWANLTIVTGSNFLELNHTLTNVAFKVEQLKASESPEVKTLDKMASLHTVTAELGFDDAKSMIILEELINRGYDNALSIAEVPLSQFVQELYQVVGDFNAAKLYQIASVRRELTQNLVQDIVSSRTAIKGIDNGTAQQLNNSIGQSCHCDDCETMVSPLAYLSDLTNYVLKNLKVAGLRINLNTLETYFYQNFIELPSSCDDVKNTVCQVRIAVEVLRRYIHANSHKVTSEQRQKLDQELRNYMMKAYQYLLEAIGTSYSEIRVTRSETAKRALAQKLGFDYDNNPDFLNKLYIEAQLKPMESWSDYKKVYPFESHETLDTLATALDSLPTVGGIPQAIDFSGFKSITATELAEKLKQIASDDNFRIALATVIKETAIESWNELLSNFNNDSTQLTDEELWAKFNSDLCKKFSIQFRQAFDSIEAEWQKRKASFNAFLSLPAHDSDEQTITKFLLSLNGTGTVSDFWLAFAGALKTKIEDFYFNERDLEEIFGMVDTSKDVFSDGAKINDTINCLSRWNLRGIEWGQNTDRDGYIHLEMDEVNAAIILYKDKIKDEASKVGIALLDTATNKFLITEYNDSGLTGELIASTIDATQEIKISAIPLYLGWRLQGLREQWKVQDEASETPAIDPDLIEPADIEYPYDIALTSGSASKPIDFWHFRKQDLEEKYNLYKTSKETNEGYSTWGSAGSGSGQFNNPNGIAIDADGAAYISDTENNRIQQRTADGTFSTIIGSGLSKPKGLYLHSDDNLYISDSANNRIYISTKGGSLLATIGNAGSELGEFNLPEGLVVDKNNNLYVADTGNGRIQRFGLPLYFTKYSQNYELVTETITEGTGGNKKVLRLIPLNVKAGDILNIKLSSDSSGSFNCFVTDAAIEKINEKIVREFSKRTSAPWNSVTAVNHGDYLEFTANAADHDFNIFYDTDVAFTSNLFFAAKDNSYYYTDKENNRVLKLDQAGNILRSFGIANRFTEDLAAFYRFDEAVSGIPAITSVNTQTGSVSQPQISHLTPQNVAKGIIFKVTIGGILSEVTASDSTIATLVAQLTEEINEALNGVSAVNKSTYVEITADSNSETPIVIATAVAKPVRNASVSSVENADIAGTPVWSSDGAVSGSIQLNGTTDYVSIASSSQLDAASFDYKTIELWFKATNKGRSGYQMLYRQGDSTKGLNAYLYNKSLYVGKYDDASNKAFISYSKISDNTWHHLTIVFDKHPVADADTFRVYVDGNLVGSANVGTTLPSTSSGVTLGSLGGTAKVHTDETVSSAFFAGSIDQLRVWNRVLDETEIQLIYTKQDSGDGYLNIPGAITLDKSGNIYIADTGNSSIQKFDGGGNFLGKTGEYGSDNGKLKSITGIATDNAGNIYVTDSGNAALLKFNALGFLKSATGSGTQNLLNPQGVAVNENGLVYVSDTGNDNIKVFNFDMDFLQQYTQFGPAGSTENFNDPTGICVDSNENIIIFNASNHKLVKLAKDGSFSDVIDGVLWDSSNGHYISADADNNICLGANASFRFRFPEAFSSIKLPTGSSLVPLTFIPSDVKTDSFGNLLISDSYNHRILKVKPDGTYINDVGILGTQESEFDAPKGIAMDGAGYIYVCDSNNNRIQKFDSSLEFFAQWTNADFSASVFSGPESIAIDANGKAVVTNKTSDTVVQFDTLEGIGAAFLEATEKTLEDLYAIVRKEKEGNSIEEDLKALHLDIKVYRHILDLIKLAGSNIPLFDSQPAELYNILTNAYKLSQYEDWKAEEVSKGITLSQDFFILRDRVQESAKTFTAWRATARQRKNWRDTLSARIDQEATLWEAHNEMQKEAEDALLQDLRDAFIMASDFNGLSLAEKATYGSKRLSIDLTNNCCMRTTRVSQSFEGLQGIMWAVRNGLVQDMINMYIDPYIPFDEEWKWMGSYATWRAAQFVFMYPENILLPSYAKKTQAFSNTITKLRDDVSLSPASALEYANEYIDYINDVNSLTLIGCNLQNVTIDSINRTLVFMVAESNSKQIYWSAFDSATNQFYFEWSKVPGLKDVIYEQAIGFQPYYDSRGGKNIYLFLKTNEEDKVNIAYIPFDLKKIQWGEMGKNTIEGEIGRILTDSEIFVNNDNNYDEFISFSVAAYSKASTEEFINRNLYEFTFTDDLKLSYVGKFDSYQGSIPVGYLATSPVAIQHSETYTIPGRRSPGTKIVYDSTEPGKLIFRQSVIPPVLSSSPEDKTWNSSHSIIGAFKSTVLFASVGNSIYYYDRAKNLWKKLIDENVPVQSIYVAYNKSTEEYIAFYEKGTETYCINLSVVQKTKSILFIKQITETTVTPLSNPLKINFNLNNIGYYAPNRLTNEIKGRIQSTFIKNQSGLNLGRQIVKEYQYLLPIQVALSLQQKGYYQEALDWFRLVYDYTKSSRLARSIYYGLYLERSISGSMIEEFDDSNDLTDWLLSPGLTITDNPVRDSNNPSPKIGLFKAPRNYNASFVIQYNSELGIDWSKPEFMMDIMEHSSNASTDGTVVWLVPRKGGNYSDCYAVYQAVTKPGLKGQWQTLNFAKDNSRVFATRIEEIKYIEVYIGYGQDRFNQHFYVDAIRTGTLPLQYRPDNWLNDALDPHAIAENRKDAYTKFTVMSIAQCMLDYADSEFTLDTAESVPRARRLYEAAIQLLESEGLSSYADECRSTADEALKDISFSDDWQNVWQSIKNDVYLIESKKEQKAVLEDLQLIYNEGGTEAFRLKAMRDTLNIALQNPTAYIDLRSTLIENHGSLSDAYSAVLADPKIKQYIDEQSQKIGQAYFDAVQEITGIKPEVLLSDTIFADGTVMSQLRDTSNAIHNDIVSLEQITGSLDDIDVNFLDSMDPSVESSDFNLQQFLLKDLKKTLANYTDYSISYKPSINFSFCIPPNPVITALRFRAELNLFKIRNCRNIAGTIREIAPFAAPTDATTGMPQIGAAGNLQLPGTSVFRPTIYRYPVLIERAKQLVQIAQQIEASMLSTLEKLDAEKYSMLKAKQDLGLSKAQITLQDLRVREAQSGVDLADLQRERASKQAEYFDGLISEDLLQAEIDGLNFLAISAGLYTTSAAIHLAAGIASQFEVETGVGVNFIYRPGALIEGMAQATSSSAQALGSWSSFFLQSANFERRRQEWNFQRDLANQDIKIGNQQVKIAEEHVAVVGQERQIAVMQSENAQATIDFLNNKFTNAELYDWMSGVLGGVYRFFLQQATAMARTASNQLSFERQELPPDYIKADYWQAPSDNLSVNGTGPDGQKTVDRKGLTGAERLLQDIYQLDQYAFTTDKRKLELTKTISLASMAPAEFQRFKETGELVFETSGEVFDRDFPGQYLRLIKRIRTSVVALVPPNQGIKATLSNRGISYTVVQGNVFQKVPIARDPEMVALTGTSNATGLFELTQIGNDKLFPFENTGVETTWTFQMPKASNFFDYSTIADVLVTIEYTALHSDVYKAQVIEELSTDFSADRAYSFKNQFADQWYDLNNPEQVADDDKMKVSFTTSKGDFPANVNNVKISQLAMYFVKADELDDTDINSINSIAVKSLVFKPKGYNPKGSSAETTAQDAIISTRKLNGANNWSAFTSAETAEGTWTLELNPADAALFKEEKIVDILFVISYKGEAPQWPK